MHIHVHAHKEQCNVMSGNRRKFLFLVAVLLDYYKVKIKNAIRIYRYNVDSPE